MGHAYTPGLRVTRHAVIQKERRLPLKGEVVVERGVDRRPHDAHDGLAFKQRKDDTDDQANAVYQQNELL